MCVYVAAAAAAAGWKYHRALRSLGQTLNSSPGQGLAFICRWVELHELREKRSSGSVHVCERRRKKEGGKQKGDNRVCVREKPLLE